MTDDEVVELLRELEALAKEVGLEGLVEQERATARAGQITEFERSRSNQRAQSYAPRKGEFRIEPVGPRQRLATLLDLLESAVVGADLTERAVLAVAKEFAEGGRVETGEVTFGIPSESSDLVTDAGAPPGVDPGELARSDQDSGRSGDRRDAIEAVVYAIRDLRQHAGVTRGEWLTEVEEGRRRDIAWPA